MQIPIERQENLELEFHEKYNSENHVFLCVFTFTIVTKIAIIRQEDTNHLRKSFTVVIPVGILGIHLFINKY